jgi:hypothetical protein
MALAFGGPSPGPGYLPRVGPSALRFKPVVPKPDLASLLPPLAMSNEPAPAPEVAVEPKPAPNDTIPLETMVAVESAPSLPPAVTEAIPSELPTDVLPDPNQPPADAAPQIIRYLNRGTNQETFISVPVQFQPPAPISRSSSATYIVR